MRQRLMVGNFDEWAKKFFWRFGGPWRIHAQIEFWRILIASVLYK
jgi:hypothetical protein